MDCWICEEMRGRKAEGGSKKLRAKNFKMSFMMNFMPMNFSFNDELIMS
jgi:hypothetical protein